MKCLETLCSQQRFQDQAMIRPSNRIIMTIVTASPKQFTFIFFSLIKPLALLFSVLIFGFSLDERLRSQTSTPTENIHSNPALLNRWRKYIEPLSDSDSSTESQEETPVRRHKMRWVAKKRNMTFQTHIF